MRILDKADKLKEAFNKMSPENAQAIKEAYYKACEGLSALEAALEVIAQDGGNKFLKEEFVIAAKANEELDKSFLGIVL